MKVHPKAKLENSGPLDLTCDEIEDCEILPNSNPNYGDVVSTLTREEYLRRTK